MKPRVWGWLCLSLLLAVAFLISLSTKQRLAGERSVLSRPSSQHSLEVAAKASLQDSRVRVEKSYLGLPLSFEANCGQTDAQVKFLSRGEGYTLFLTRSGDAVLALREPEPKGDGRERVAQGATPKALESWTAVVSMHMVGGNARPEVQGVGELPGKANYFIGKDATKWRRKVPLFSKVIYRQVYHGVDLVYYGQQRELEHDFVVAPGSDPRAITLRFAGTKAMSIDSSGALALEVEGGQVRFEKPRMYQEVQGAWKEIPGGYVLKNGHDIGFKVAAYDASQPLVIDPTLAYSTYLGGSAFNEALAVAVDARGNAYVTGSTRSTDFPTTPGAFQSSKLSGPFNTSAFVTVLNSDGSGLVYSTYLGGNGIDVGLGIAVDAADNAYVTGSTRSTDFPTTPGAFQSARRGANAFVTVLNADGSGLIYSTYLGGSRTDSAHGIAIDAAGNAYVTGSTLSTDFPTTPGAFQSSKPSPDGLTAFVTALNADGSGLIYSTYLGGSDGYCEDGLCFGDVGVGIALRQPHREDQESGGPAAVQVYVTGSAYSSDFPTTPGAFQSGKPSGPFVTVLNADGSGLIYSTYLGGRYNYGEGIAVDAAGNAYVTGFTTSADFPTTADAFQSAKPSRPGAFTPFVTVLNADGSGLIYSTYFGGSSFDHAYGIAVDAAGNAYVTGLTNSADFPTTPDAFQPAQQGRGNAFVAQLAGFPTEQCPPSSEGECEQDARHGSVHLAYSTYLGGSGSFGDYGQGIAIDAAGNAYVAGFTESTDFPTTPGAFQTTNPGPLGPTLSGFVAKIAGFQQRRHHHGDR